MAFFVFVKMGRAPLSRASREIKQLLREQSLFLYYIKQIDFMLPCICPVIDHRGRQNVVITSVTHSAIAWCATFLFLLHFDVFCDLLLDRCTATWNLFVKLIRKYFLNTSSRQSSFLLANQNAHLITHEPMKFRVSKVKGCLPFTEKFRLFRLGCKW